MKNAPLSLRPRHVFGLSIAIRAAPETRCGFRGAETQNDVPVFGMSRWEGFCAALDTGLARKITILGGYERWPLAGCDPRTVTRADDVRDDTVFVSRSRAAAQFLITERGQEPERVRWAETVGNTDGNYARIRSLMGDLPEELFAVTAPFYHLPRSMMIAAENGLGNLLHVPTEAFLFIEKTLDGKTRTSAMSAIAADLGGGPLAERAAMEIAGAADRVLGTYAPLSS